MPQKIFLPSVLSEVALSSSNSPKKTGREIMYDLIAGHPHQQRKTTRFHPLLVRAALNRANDMATKNYFSHTSPSGKTVHEFIRETGYKLPYWYKIKGNNCESILKTSFNSKIANVVEGWYNSPAHRVHVFGHDKFFRDQEWIGTGIAKSIDGHFYYVFISAPPY
jgi:hypothetical protein